MSAAMTERQPDYYRLLQIPRQASQMDIINAYRHAKLAYQEDSLAVYSLYAEDEIAIILDEIEEAYAVLSDPDKRREYDSMLTPVSSDEGGSGDSQSHPGRKNVIPLRMQYTGGPVRLDDYSGSNLRRFREEGGISLQAIAERTRISRRYLQAIEEEDASNFPETVYLKGYLRQYCREIGLDPEYAVSSYMARLESMQH